MRPQYSYMAKSLIGTFLIVILFSCGSAIDKQENLEYDQIKIDWMKNLSGSFSFKEIWDYPEGIYRNDFGQLSCDGLCPAETDKMKDDQGRIFKDSLPRFYQLVDTTHLFHSIKSHSNSYEWSGTNFLTAEKMGNDTIHCFTDNNASTHSSLDLIITKNKCIPAIKLSSITGTAKTAIYICKKGYIEIDKNLWNNGILKAKFDFTFDSKENLEKSIFWKGKIYTPIKAE